MRNGIVMLVLVAATAALLYALIQPSSPTSKSYSDFYKDMTSGNVTTIVRQDNTLTVTDANGTQYTVVDDAPANGDYAIFGTWNVPNLKSINYTVNPPPNTGWIMLLLSTVVPVGLVILLIFFFMRQAQGTNNQALSFGKSRARMFLGNKPVVTFADVAGVDEAKTELAGSRRVPQVPREVQLARRAHPARRAARRASGNRQDPAGPSRRRRGGRAVLLASPAPSSSRCSSASAPAASATCSTRPSATRPASSSSTRSTRSAASAAPAWAARTTSASRP